jgi:hypothetical protein
MKNWQKPYGVNVRVDIFSISEAILLPRREKKGGGVISPSPLNWTNQLLKIAGG